MLSRTKKQRILEAYKRAYKKDLREVLTKENLVKDPFYLTHAVKYMIHSGYSPITKKKLFELLRFVQQKYPENRLDEETMTVGYQLVRVVIALRKNIDKIEFAKR